MIIKDVEGKFEIQVNTSRKLFEEKIVGQWTKEDFTRFENTYKTKLLPTIKSMGKFAKICDMTDFKMGMINEELESYAKWAIENGYTYCATVMPKEAIVKMFFKRVSKGGLTTDFFDDKKKADEWLKSVGH